MEEHNNRFTILIVDDNADNISLLKAALLDDYNIKAAKSGSKALEIARTMLVDLILLDVMMPDMDGFETCSHLKEDPRTSGIPVIFITARREAEIESRGFSCGGVDYITKPISAPIVQARVRTHLALYKQNRILEENVRKRTAELNESRLEILRRLGLAAEFKDNETGLHIIRMSRYCKIIALAYGLPDGKAELLYNVSPMHDIGKIGIPDSIMLKPGKLDDEEWRHMQKHCEIGHRIINSNSSTLLSTSAMLAYTHHERWDGSGYPEGKRGEEIPLFSRILAIADVFDALTTVRPYKNAWTVEDAVGEIKRCSDSHFDPALVEVFLRCLPDIIKVKQEFADSIS
jgi:putative two-component system response regulator